MSQCPDCKIEIGGSTYCACGWSYIKQHARDAGEQIPIDPYGRPYSFVACAFDPCERRAVIKIPPWETKAGWVNCCLDHYDEFFKIRAEKKCAELGLTTVAQKKAWVLAEVRKLAQKMKPEYMREPGDD